MNTELQTIAQMIQALADSKTVKLEYIRDDGLHIMFNGDSVDYDLTTLCHSILESLEDNKLIGHIQSDNGNIVETYYVMSEDEKRIEHIKQIHKDIAFYERRIASLRNELPE